LRACGDRLRVGRRPVQINARSLQGDAKDGMVLAAAGIGFAVVQTRVDPLQLTEYAVVASAVAMPLSFYPIIRVSQDREVMGEQAGAIVARHVDWLSYAVVCVVAIAGPILS
jgi:manganese transport protein